MTTSRLCPTIIATLMLSFGCNEKPPSTNNLTTARGATSNAAPKHQAALNTDNASAEKQSISQWDGTIHQWGGMREVLALGQTQARITLTDAVARPHAYGVGALAGLMGEITLIDGRAYVAQLEGQFVTSTIRPEHDATLLAAAYVPGWQSIPIEQSLDGRELMKFIKAKADQGNVYIDKPFPFLIEGNLSVAAHIINGSCPRAGGEEPIRFQCNNRHGTIVGLYAEDAVGTLTHHGDVSHMHVVFENEPAQSGHVDDVVVQRGTLLKLPQTKWN